jgi:hypothetical protein
MGVGMKTFVTLAIAAGFATSVAAASAPELVKSKNAAALKYGVVYHASLFSPQLLIKTTAPGWQGSQYESNRYHWLQLVFWGNDPSRGGGMSIASAPGSNQTTATTIHTLLTERATSPNVGIKVGPIVSVTLHGSPAQQFDGTVTGPEGHTFVPFSGKSSGSSEAAGDHFKLLHNDLFRIIVTKFRGTPIVFFLDSGGAPKLNPAFLRASTTIVNAMRFTGG